MNDILYARPISSLSNGVYLKSLRPSVAEQSVWDPSGVGPFFAVFDFSISNVNSPIRGVPWDIASRTPSVPPQGANTNRLAKHGEPGKLKRAHSAPTAKVEVPETENARF